MNCADILPRLEGVKRAVSPTPSEAKEGLQALLKEHDVARITGLSVASVRRWRLLREGPRYLKIGAAVRYRPEDVAAWLESRPTGGGGNQ